MGPLQPAQPGPTRLDTATALWPAEVVERFSVSVRGRVTWSPKLDVSQEHRDAGGTTVVSPRSCAIPTPGANSVDQFCRKTQRYRWF